MASKDSIRREVRRRRGALSAAAVDVAGRLIADAFRDLRLIAEASRVFAYVATDSEVPARGIVDLAHRLDIPVGLPATGKVPRFLRHGCGAPLVDSSWGIPQPASIEVVEPDADSVVVLPLVACSPTGTRLGRGGGWYDRAAATWPATALRVGIGFDFQVIEDVPRDDWDVPVHILVTDRRVLSWLGSDPLEIHRKEGTDRDGICVDIIDQHRVGGRVRLVDRQAAKPAA